MQTPCHVLTSVFVLYHLCFSRLKLADVLERTAGFSWCLCVDLRNNSDKSSLFFWISKVIVHSVSFQDSAACVLSANKTVFFSEDGSLDLIVVAVTWRKIGTDIWLLRFSFDCFVKLKYFFPFWISCSYSVWDTMRRLKLKYRNWSNSCSAFSPSRSNILALEQWFISGWAFQCDRPMCCEKWKKNLFELFIEKQIVSKCDSS